MTDPTEDLPAVYETTVKLYLEDEPSAWVPCAMVYLYDRDRLSRDDFIGMDITDSYGEAKFRFDASHFLDLDDRVGGSLPELFVKVFGRDDELLLSTRATAVRNQVPTLIRVAIPRELARRHRLL